MSKEQLMSQEERSFQEYLGKIHGAYTSEKLSYFEHNLEVMVACQMESTCCDLSVAVQAAGGLKAVSLLIFSDMEAAVAGVRDV